MQSGQAQRVLPAGDDQAILAGAKNRPRRALPFGQIGGQDFQGFFVQRAMADRPGVEGADQTLELISRTCPVQTRFVLVQFVGIVGQAVILNLADQRTVRQTGNGLQNSRRTEFGEAIMQRAARVLRGNRGDGLEQHRPGVQARFHAHHGHAALCITGLHRTLNRRRTAPARQQRRMAVDATQARNIQHHLRQDQAVGDDHHQIRLQRCQFSLRSRIAQCGRLHDRYVVLQRQLLDRAGHQLLSTTGRAIGLGVHGNDLVRAVEQGLEVFGGEFRGAGEDDAQWLSHGVLIIKKGLFRPFGVTTDQALSLCCFSSFFLIRSRLRLDR
ncbi:hypothetical protein ALP24_05654 [Pseudomonas syringae pv. aptata]|uniref:Uncharacterized protein n=1 Tax=Pseudomonas syringae pv. aptata TaxID=83167 RepID=A0A3M5X6R2_PSEAP|nr:hypothetical protein ALP24_05654 [Pseudomonas syringae pv. aptata]